MRIHCFGDSFIEHPNDEESDYWQFILQRHFKDYGYKNYAICGTGSIYSIQRFIEQIEKDRLKENDIVVFHLSHISRDFDQWDRALRKPYINLINGATHVVDNNSFFCTYLYHMSQILKIKLILFAVDIKEPSLYELNNNYFHLSKIDLFDVTQRELLLSQQRERYDAWWKDTQDLRTNHLSEDNHKIMAEYIINVIEKKELPSFKSNYKTANDLFSPREYVYD